MCEELTVTCLPHLNSEGIAEVSLNRNSIILKLIKQIVRKKFHIRRGAQRKKTDNNFRTFHAITKQKTNTKKGMESEQKEILSHVTFTLRK